MHIFLGNNIGSMTALGELFESSEYVNCKARSQTRKQTIKW